MLVQYTTRGACPTCADIVWCEMSNAVVCECSDSTIYPDDASQVNPISDSEHEAYFRSHGYAGELTFQQI